MTLPTRLSLLCLFALVGMMITANWWGGWMNTLEEAQAILKDVEWFADRRLRLDRIATALDAAIQAERAGCMVAAGSIDEMPPIYDELEAAGIPQAKEAWRAGRFDAVAAIRSRK